MYVCMYAFRCIHFKYTVCVDMRCAQLYNRKQYHYHYTLPCLITKKYIHLYMGRERERERSPFGEAGSQDGGAHRTGRSSREEVVLPALFT